MDPYSVSLTTLSAMIAPVVLISACGTLILSTTNRLNLLLAHVRDQVHLMADDGAEADSPHSVDRTTVYSSQLDRYTERARLLQLSLVLLYLALATFVLTSVAIAAAAVMDNRIVGWAPLAIGLVGFALLLVTGILLIIEARQALITTHRELDLLWRSAERPMAGRVLDQLLQAEERLTNGRWRYRRARRGGSNAKEIDR